MRPSAAIVNAPPDRRLAQRRRTRLRSGRLFDIDGRFLTDCAVRDRTPLGAALALGASRALPEAIAFYDDERRSLHSARVVWAGNGACGIVFVTAPREDRHARGAFGGAFYALGASRRLTRSLVSARGCPSATHR